MRAILTPRRRQSWLVQALTERDREVARIAVYCDRRWNIRTRAGQTRRIREDHLIKDQARDHPAVAHVRNDIADLQGARVDGGRQNVHGRGNTILLRWIRRAQTV